MTYIGVMADSHGCVENVRSAAWEMRGCRYIVHLGDHDRDAEAIGFAAGVGVIMVKGNCDWFSDAQVQAQFRVEDVDVFASHGNLEGVKGGLTFLKLKCESLGARLALYGHTHVASVEEDGGITFVNPGSLRDGRYAVVAVDGERVHVDLKRL